MANLDKATFEAAFNRSAEEAGIPADAGGEQDPRVDALWQLLEPRLEDRGRFESQVRDYLDEHTKDVRDWRSGRTFAVGFAVSIIALFTFGLAWILFCPLSPVSLDSLSSDGVRIALLTGPFAIIFGLTALILKGAFSHGKREDTAPPVPENAKLLAELLNGIISKN